jgi:hypothetical protein
MFSSHAFLAGSKELVWFFTSHRLHTVRKNSTHNGRYCIVTFPSALLLRRRALAYYSSRLE